MILSILVVALLGLIIGSFLNVVILRYNTGHSNGGRSMCLSCAKKLSWSELVPVVSFFALRRKCQGCKSSISWQYPLVELSTSALFVIILFHVVPLFSRGDIVLFVTHFILLAIIWSLLVVIFVYDFYHKIIPNALVYTAALLALVYRLTLVPWEFFPTIPLFDVLAGLIFFSPFGILWLISSGRWLGLGDAKLAMVIGWLLGFITGASTLIIAVWIGASVGVYLWVMSLVQKKTFNHELPFAPFLIIATLIGFLVPIDLFYDARLLFSFI
jgi:prepilin signal peptidase PulO-like enzyme (type II secretory pathway)